MDLHHQGVKQIYLAIDGSKDNQDDMQSKIEVGSRLLAAELKIDLRIWRRNTNLGPAVSVITAIDWFFSNEERGIILEDDLILSDDAINYFDFALRHYNQNKSVFMIAGSNFFDDIVPGNGGVLASCYPVIWGWATWKDRWNSFRSTLNQLESLQINAPFHERWFWSTGLRRCFNGVKDAWDIPLATYQQSYRYLSILPPVNLVSNIGHDVFAGNTFVNEWPLNFPVKRMTPDAVRRYQSSVGHFDESLSGEINSRFRNRIYQIRKYRTLPPSFSTLFDFFRYPKHTRRGLLLDRLSQINQTQ
jgi:hypothetical protein